MPGGSTSATATPITSLPYSDSGTSALKISAAAANASADAVATLLDGGTIRIYTAPQPATADTAITTQTLLASPIFGSPAFSAAVAGLATAHAVTHDTDAAASGTASWARFVTSGGATVFDGSVGTTSAANCRLGSTTITQHGTVSVTSSFFLIPANQTARWYLYTAPTPVESNELGVFVYSAGSNNLALSVFSPDAVTPYQIGSSTAFASVRNAPIQFPVTAGVSYYLKIAAGGNAGDYAISVLAGPTDSAPAGSLFVNDDSVGWPLVLLSATTGAPLRFITPFPPGETADVLTTGANLGRILLHDRTDAGSDDRLKLYSPQFDLLADLAYHETGAVLFPIRSNRSTTFYVGKPVDPSTGKASVTTVTAAGAFGATTWNLPASGLKALAPSVDETILYLTGQTVFVNSPVKRWDLVNSVFLTDLAAGIANYRTGMGSGLLVLTDDTIVVVYENNVSDSNAPIVKRYATDGTVLTTITMTGSLSHDTRIATALDDPVSFWLWTKVTTGINRFTNLRASDGATLTTFDVPQFETGIYAPAVSASPLARFGASESCPFLITRAVVPIPPITGTIDLTAPGPASGETSELALTGYPTPPRHPDAFCGRRP